MDPIIYSMSLICSGDMRKKSLMSRDMKRAPLFASEMVELRMIVVSSRFAVGGAVSQL